MQLGYSSMNPTASPQQPTLSDTQNITSNTIPFTTPRFFPINMPTKNLILKF
jgi:hypothetical protein